MQEYKIEIEIDENGDINAETKGILGKSCVNEIDNILKGLEGEREEKNNSDYYKKGSVRTTNTLKTGK